MRKLISSLAVAAAFVSVTPAANAATAMFSFTDCLSGSCGTSSVATLILSNITNGVSFSLSTTSGLAASYVKGLYFNGPSGAVAWLGPEFPKEIAWSSSANASKAAAAGYNWDVTFAKGVLGAGETLGWTVTGNGVDLSDFTTTPKFMLSMKDLGSNGTARVAAVAVVPEPASAAMLIAGLGVVGAMMRRRRQSI